jgi:hypothetical protein
MATNTRKQAAAFRSRGRFPRFAAWGALAAPLLAAGAALLARRADDERTQRVLTDVHFGLVALGIVLAVVAIVLWLRRRATGVIVPASVALALGVAFASTAGRTWRVPCRKTAASDVHWQPYVSTEGRFAAIFPGPPVGRAVGPAGGFQAHDVAATLPDGSIFGVTWLDTPGLSGAAADNGQTLLNAILARRSGTGQVLSQRPLSVQTHPGHELRLRVPADAGPNLLISRDYVVGPRSYQLLVQLPESDEKRRGREIELFFESFRLIPADFSQASSRPAATLP